MSFIWITYTLLLGMSAATMITIFRAVPPGLWLVKKGTKPWACDICMSFWMTIFSTIIAIFSGLIVRNDLWISLPSYIVCLWLVRQTRDIDLFSDYRKSE